MNWEIFLRKAGLAVLVDWLLAYENFMSAPSSDGVSGCLKCTSGWKTNPSLVRCLLRAERRFRFWADGDSSSSDSLGHSGMLTPIRLIAKNRGARIQWKNKCFTESHLSKRKSDLKQKCKQLMTPFLSIWLIMPFHTVWSILLGMWALKSTTVIRSFRLNILAVEEFPPSGALLK